MTFHSGDAIRLTWQCRGALRDKLEGFNDMTCSYATTRTPPICACIARTDVDNVPATGCKLAPAWK